MVIQDDLMPNCSLAIKPHKLHHGYSQATQAILVQTYVLGTNSTCFIGAIIDDNTGNTLKYQQLIKIPKYWDIWTQSLPMNLVDCSKAFASTKVPTLASLSRIYMSLRDAHILMDVLSVTTNHRRTNRTDLISPWVDIALTIFWTRAHQPPISPPLNSISTQLFLLLSHYSMALTLPTSFWTPQWSATNTFAYGWTSSHKTLLTNIISTTLSMPSDGYTSKFKRTCTVYPRLASLQINSSKKILPSEATFNLSTHLVCGNTCDATSLFALSWTTLASRWPVWPIWSILSHPLKNTTPLQSTGQVPSSAEAN